MSRWKLILALKLSTLFSKYWILVSRMLSRGGLWALFLSLLRIPAHFPSSFLIHRFGGLFKRPLFISAFWRISNGHDGLEDKVSWNRLVFRLSNVQKCSFVISDQCRCYVCKERKQKQRRHLDNIFSMNCSSPVPAALMQPQTMTLPPPCLTVGKTHVSLYSSPGCFHTHLTPSEPLRIA